MQHKAVYYSASSVYMFRVSTTPIIRSTQNCSYSLRYWSYFLCSYLATLEGGSCTVPEAVVTVLCTPVYYFGTGHIFCAVTSLKRRQASLATLEVLILIIILLISTGGCSYSFVYS